MMENRGWGHSTHSIYKAHENTHKSYRYSQVLLLQHPSADVFWWFFTLGIPFLAIIKYSHWVPTQHIPALSLVISFLTDGKVRHKRGEGSYPRSPSRLLEEPGIEPTSLEAWFSPLARTPHCLLLQSNILTSLATLFTIPA